MFQLKELGFNDEELLEIWDEEENLTVRRGVEETNKQDAMRKVRELINETDMRWGLGRRLEYVEGKVKNIELLYKRMSKRNYPFWLRKVLGNLWDADKWIKEKTYIERLLAMREESKQIRGINDSDIQQAKNTSILLWLNQDTVKIHNGYSVARCPFGDHEDKTPSFTFYENGGWKCFGCGRSGGDSIAFIMELKGLSFPETVKFLNGEMRSLV